MIFVPFHYGYWDAGDDAGPEGRPRAANELTMTIWDPVSKQPQLKTAAVKVDRVVMRIGPLLTHLRELETGLAAELRAAAGRHRGDHDVFHQCHTFALAADKRAESLEPLAERYGGESDWTSAVGPASDDLLEDLRTLYLRTDEARSPGRWPSRRRKPRVTRICWSLRRPVTPRPKPRASGSRPGSRQAPPRRSRWDDGGGLVKRRTRAGPVSPGRAPSARGTARARLLRVGGCDLRHVRATAGMGRTERRTQVALCILAFTVPLQFTASIFGFLARDGVAATGMGLLSGIWATVGLITLTGEPGSTSDALGLFLLIAGVAMWAPASAAAAPSSSPHSCSQPPACGSSSPASIN